MWIIPVILVLSPLFWLYIDSKDLTGYEDFTKDKGDNNE